MDSTARKRMYQAIDQLTPDKLTDYPYVRQVLRRASVPLAVDGTPPISMNASGCAKEPVHILQEPDYELDNYIAMLMSEFCPGCE